MVERAFRDAILAAPRDDAPALIYADWIEERGDPDRAAVLRRFVACGLPRHGAGLHRLFTFLDEAAPFGPIPFVWDNNAAGIALCWCPPTGPGGFLMGSPPDEADRPGDGREDQVTVRLTRGFWLGKVAVTQEQWRLVMGGNPSYFASGGGGRDGVRGMDTGAFPVENVSWHQAAEFGRKLTDREHEAGRLPTGWEYRLPTEAQWEYACRAGTTTATAFGKSLSSRQANFDGNFPYNGAREGPYLERTAEVGSYAENAWNLQDMHGNVWEWCLDTHEDELPGGVDPPVRSQGADAPRVLRGGGWDYDGGSCRSASRGSYDPSNNRYGYYGFRLARVPRVQ